MATPIEHMHKKFEINWTKIKGSCQSRRKVVTQMGFFKMGFAENLSL